MSRVGCECFTERRGSLASGDLDMLSCELFLVLPNY